MDEQYRNDSMDRPFGDQSSTGSAAGTAARLKEQILRQGRRRSRSS